MIEEEPIAEGDTGFPILPAVGVAGGPSAEPRD